ncbi:MAG TPA: PEP-CTERM sorting domain-containing protein [Tepidisphaeraceae bacterium]|nr:PEP-CTERM sorting domain-containing protein [Tepidisphaeraceae bacterium]
MAGHRGGRWDSLSVGLDPNTTGRFHLTDGVFHAGSQVIGGQGAGTFRQSRGWNFATFLQLGAGPGGSGIYDLSSGTIVVAPPGGAAVYPGAPAPPPGTPGGIYVGGEGSGALHLGGNGHGGGGSIIQPRGPNSPRPVAPATPGGPPATPLQPSLVVRNAPDGSGLIRGFGSAIGDGGTFENNGQVIADAGGGQFRSLIFLGYGAVTSTIENGPGGHNGWFARGGGRLVLPKIVTAPGTHTYTWGEDALDPTLDLVNSARITLYDAQNPAKLDISLMDKTRPEVPSLPKGHTFIGVWSMDTGIARPAGADLAVRYDDGLAAQLGLNEASLKLWRYDATTAQWQRINDGSFARDMENNILSGHAEGPTSFFAVSAPEPSALGVLAIAGAAALRRRRRA